MAQEDKFEGHAKSRESPGEEWAVITPHDTDKLAFLPKFLYIGATAGTVTVKSRSGVQATFHAAAGQRLDIRPDVIMATGTTATPIIAIKE